MAVGCVALAASAGAGSVLQKLPVPGFAPAVYVAPRPEPADGDARPVVVVLHGNFDRPEWECDAWDHIVAGRGWILCPRGIPRRDAPGLDRWTYRTPKGMRAEIDAGVAALRARYGAAVADVPPIYAGFSLGAILGNKIVTSDPKAFPRAFMVEGGAGFWTPPRARAFVAAGGQAVFFGCGGAGCGKRAEEAAAVLTAAGARSEVVTVKGLGHDYGPPFPARAKPLFDVLVAGAPGW